MRVALLATIAALALAGCARSSEGRDHAPTPNGDLSELACSRTQATEGGPACLKGILIANLGSREDFERLYDSRTLGVRICHITAQSAPPLCGEPSVLVEGLDLRSLRGLEESRNGPVTVLWTPRRIRVCGKVNSRVLTAAASCDVPLWVKEVARRAVQGKVGDTKPEAVRYLRREREWRVVYEFATVVRCTGCHRAWDSPVTKGHRAEVGVDTASRLPLHWSCCR